jgi:putative solute:sodium symporter small subunit
MTTPPERRQRAGQYRRSHIRLSVVLMVVWGLVSFVLPFYARELSFMFLGWPFSFWMAAQGAILVYLAIVIVYAYRMNRLDDQHHQPHHDDA